MRYARKNNLLLFLIFATCCVCLIALFLRLCLPATGASREEDHIEETGRTLEEAGLSPEEISQTVETTSELSLEEKLSQLRELFPDGKYWNTAGTDTTDLSQEEACLIVTDIPCDHSLNGYCYCHQYNGKTRDEFSYENNIQCLAFASMISDYLFGADAEIEIFYDYDQLSVGDHIRFLSLEHSVIVTEKTESYIRVVECNQDYENCQIQWDREISREDLLENSASYEFLRRVT